MNNDIFLLDARGQASVLRQASYSSEDKLQNLIANHPEVLNCVLSPASEPSRWIFVAREVGVPDHGGGSAQWFLDHLLLAQDAIPTLVEVKRSTDSRIRREVVGQMLDYAVNGCAYWDVSALRSDYETRCRDTGRDPLTESCVDAEAVDTYWMQVETNLRNRKLRLLFVADEIPDNLRRIIEFLNEQMENTEVLGVELRQFISDQEHQILAPQVIGKTTPAQQIKSRSTFAWTEESYMERAEAVVGKDQADTCRRLVRAFEELGCEIYWGRGRKQAGFVPIYQGKRRHQLCAVYIYENHIGIEIYFEHFKAPYDTVGCQRELMNAFNAIPGINLQENRLGKRPSFKAKELLCTETLISFISVYRTMLEKIRKYEESLTGQ